MSRVLLQPASSAEAQGHYHDTVARPVTLSRLTPFLPANEINALQVIYPGGTAMIWGLTPGRGPTIWPQINRGDIVLFYASGFIISSAFVRTKVKSMLLAADLWGTDSKGQAWEYVYFIDELIPRKLPVAELARALGRAPNWIVQGAELLPPDKSARLDVAFGLFSEDAPVEVTTAAYTATVSAPAVDQPLDKQGYRNMRVEQGYLRNILFGGKPTAECALCGHEFPTSMLVCAHLKKRFQCSAIEKLDAAHIVLPMCTFACDELYESRMISIKSGAIVKLDASRATAEVQRRIDELAGRFVLGYKPEMQKYIDFTAG